jgi:predicted HAD superfamily phosphohydrolase YqeG
VVDGLAEAVDVAAHHGDVLVVDLENTLVDYGSTVEQRTAAMVEAVEAAAAAGLRHLAFVSNARFALPPPAHGTLVVEALAAARKPHLSIPPLRRLRSRLAGAAVYGDQPLTDGMLARNLGGIWLQPRHAHELTTTAPESEPWWPRVMRGAGRKVIEERFQPTAWSPAVPGPPPAPGAPAPALRSATPGAPTRPG